MISKLARYRAPDQLKKQIFNILINNIESEVIEQWNRNFEKLDSDNSGMIKIKEIIKLIEKTGSFKSQLKQLKEINKKDPNLKINYSDFLLRIVDIKQEVKKEDIANAFMQFDTDKTGKIDVKKIQSFLKRRGEDITEEDALAMIGNAEDKITASTAGFKKGKKSKKNRSNDDVEAPVAKEIDYPMFKTYLLAPSPESQTQSLLKRQSSLRFSEYRPFINGSSQFDSDKTNDGAKSRFADYQTNDTCMAIEPFDGHSQCKGKLLLPRHFW